MGKFTITCNGCGSNDVDVDYLEWEDYTEIVFRCNGCNAES
jgi:hypothetical protein